MGHIHAAAMAEYAKDAAETDKPWERWESVYRGRTVALASHPQWDACFEYHRKPKVVLINGHEVPEPCRTPLQDGEYYWTISLIRGVTRVPWQNDNIDDVYLKNGFIHLTKEAAEKHFNALKSFTAQKEWPMGHVHTTKGKGAKQ